MIQWSKLDKADRRMYLLFGALTLWTPAGILLAAVSLMNGLHQEWPPDNLTETIGFWTAIAVFVALFAGTLWSAGVRALRAETINTVTAFEVVTVSANHDGQ